MDQIFVVCWFCFGWLRCIKGYLTLMMLILEALYAASCAFFYFLYVANFAPRMPLAQIEYYSVLSIDCVIFKEREVLRRIER